MATVLDKENDIITENDIGNDNDSDYVYRRSSSLQYYTPTEEDATSSGDSSEIHSRSLSLSSRKRLSNLFKSLSDRKERTNSLTKKFRNPLKARKESTVSSDISDDQHKSTLDGSYEEPNAPIATPEKSRSSSGDTLEEIKEEAAEVIGTHYTIHSVGI